MDEVTLSEEVDADGLPRNPEALPAGQPICLLVDVDPGAAAALRKVPLIWKHRAKRAVTRTADSVFWDTGDYRIGGSGLSLAIEAQGRRRKQVMRGIAAAPVLQQARPSAEFLLPPGTVRPDPVRLAFLPIAGGEPLNDITVDALAPIFAISTRRSQCVVTAFEQQFAIVIEESSVSAAAGERKLLQLAISNLSGDGESVYRFVRELGKAIDLTLASEDPVRTGYRLASGVPPSSWNAAPVLHASMRVRDAALCIGQHICAELRCATADLRRAQGMEEVHKARVAARKLRSLISSFKDVLPSEQCEQLSAGLRDFASGLGTVREWDVLMTETIAPVSAALKQMPHGRESVSVLAAAARDQRQEAGEQVRKTMSGSVILTLDLRLSAFFEAGLWNDADCLSAEWHDKPALAFARAVLQKRYKKLKRAGRQLNDPSADELHKLRIQSKKMRYLAEFFEPLYSSKGHRRFVSALKRLQDTLGILHDAAVTGGLLAAIKAPLASPSIQQAEATGLILGWTAAAADKARRNFDELWADFLDTKRFW